MEDQLIELNTDDEATPMITPSEIIEHIYCPRFTYFMNCLDIQQNEHLRYKVLKGRQLHEKKEKTNTEYLRKRIECIKKEISVYLASKNLKVRGVVDEVIYLRDGTLAPLDYKYTEYSEYTFKTHKIQSVLYGMLIEENYNSVVKKGFIYYARGMAKIKEIYYTNEDKTEACKIIDEIFNIIEKGFFPRKTKYDIRCIDCCYRNICPK
jgi:CRISPR-associated exonuclease Cas4